ncbi:hypothetical protein [Sphingomonas oryzagri]
MLTVAGVQVVVVVTVRRAWRTATWRATGRWIAFFFSRMRWAAGRSA